MFYCECGQPVRATYCPDDNIHYPEDDCQDCHELNDFIFEERASIKAELQKLDFDELPF